MARSISHLWSRGRTRRVVMLTVVCSLITSPLLESTAAPASRTRDGPPSAQTNGAVRDGASTSESFAALREAGFVSIYNLDYPAARVTFERMVEIEPGHPAGHFYIASYHWLSTLDSMRRLQIGLYNRDAFYMGKDDKVDPRLDRQFRDAAQKAIDVAQARVAASPKDAEALYYLGAAFGLRASYEATVVRRFGPAMRDATKGVKYHRMVVQIDPSYADAYLSIGLYDYIVGTLPWPVKLLLAIGGVRGNRRRGIEEIASAAEKGKYARDDARTMLVAIYAREGNWAEATRLLDDLLAKYPQNYLFQLERATALSNLGRRGECYEIFDRLLANKRALAVGDLIHFRYGESLLDAGEYARAAERFGAAAAASKADPALVTVSLVRRGQALDALGQREAAVEAYALALKREDAFGAHEQARQYLRKPFTPTARPMALPAPRS